MHYIRRITYILSALLFLGTPGYAQFSTCDSNLVNAHLNPAGYKRLWVPTQKCSMYYYSTTVKYGIDAHRDATNLNVPQVILDNLQENNDVSAALFAQGVYSTAGTGADVWLGITDSATLYNWRIMATGAPATFFNWSAGDPNNLSPSCKVGGSCVFCGGADAYWCAYGEDCAVINASGMWLDNTCKGSNNSHVVLLELNTCPVISRPRDTSICLGNTVNETIAVQSSGTAPYTYAWNPGSLSGQSISVSPTTTTTYTVEASDHYLCKADTTFTINVTTPTPPVINKSLATICKGSNDNISLNTVSGTATYSWSFGNSATIVSGSGGGPYSINWSTAGVKTISVTVTDNGCTTSATTTVTVDSANAAFTASPLSTCANQNVTVTVTSVSATATYSWGFSGATINSGTGSGPYSIDWATPGTRTIGLTVTDNTCTASSSVSVNISAAPAAAFTLNPTSACAGQNVTATVTTTSATAAYAWSFGGATVVSGSGSGPYTLTWPTAGTKTVSLTVTDNGCQATASATENISTPPNAAFTVNPTFACINQNITATLTSASATATYVWAFSGGTVVSGSGAGPYTVSWGSAGLKAISVTATDNGCSASSSVNVNITNTPTPGFSINPFNDACPGQTVTITPSGAISATATYTWNFDGATVLSGTGPGPYTVSWPTAGPKNLDVTVTDGGCTATSITRLFQVDPTPVADAGADIQLCPAAIGTIGTATTSGYTYSWSPATGLNSTTVSNPTVTASANNTGANITTTYTVTVTSGTCTTSDAVQVTIYPTPVSSFTISPSGACPNSNVTVTYSGTVSGTATYAWAFGTATVVSGSGAGPYTVSWPATGTKTITLTVTDNGCSSTTSNTISINNSLAPAFTLSPATACIAQPVSATLTGTPSGTSTYAWSFNGGTVISGSGAGPYSVSWGSTGTQTVDLTVTDGGCTGSTSQTVSINSGPAADAGADIQICPGTPGTIGAAATAGYTYSWSPATGLSSTTVASPTVLIASNPTGANTTTTYTVTVTSGTCTASDAVQVTIYPDVSSSFTFSPSSTCVGSDITVTYTGTASGTATYNWNFNGGNVTSGSGAGPYTVNWSNPGNQTIDVTVTDNGCIGSSSATVSVSSSLTPAFTLSPSTTACAGQPVTVTLTGTPSATATYTWSFNGATVLSGSGAGPYSISWAATGTQSVGLTETDGGCTGTATAQSVTITNGATADAGVDIQICPGTAGALGSTPVSGYTYSWSPAWGLSDPNISNPTVTIPTNPTGSNIDTFYVVTASSGSCTATDTVKVTIYPDINNNFTVSASSACTGDNVTVTYSGTPSATATYTWNFGGANVVSGSGAGPYVISWTTNGSYTITLDVSDHGCSSSAQGSQAVTVGTKPTAIAGTSQTVCSGVSIQLGSAAVAGVAYAWTPSTDLSSATVSDPTFSETNTGTSPDVISYMLIATAGCPDTAYVTITVSPVSPLGIVTSGGTSFCQGDSVVLYATSATLVDYTWSTHQTTSAITATTSGIYSVTGHDASGCLYISTPSVTVTVSPNPTVALATNGAVPESCTGAKDGSLTVAATNGTPAYTYVWNTTPPQNSATASNLAPGAYQVSVTDNNGCTDTASFTVSLAPYLGVNIDSFKNISCYQHTDGAIYASAVGGSQPVTYLWSTGAVTPAITGLAADTFTISVSDARGCTVDTSIVVTDPGPLTITPISPLHIAYGGSEQIELSITPASSNYTYNWSGTALSCIICPNPVASPLQTTTYTLTVTDATLGCSTIDTLTVFVDASKNIFIPNAFTPNGDGVNDVYMIYASGPVKFFDLQIFDRWGEKVYESNDMGSGWDGTYRGVYASNGEYVYVTNITFLDNQTQANKGSLTLIR